MIGRTVSHYKILTKIGEGGMGDVYLAEDLELRRKVALKFLPSEFASNQDALSRFKREAQAAAALNHPNIITVHEIGVHEERHFIVMAYIDGETLTEAIARQDLSLQRALDIAIQVSEGLFAAHEAGVVHRDVKPANMLIGADGRVKILDFGIAKLRGVTKLTEEASTLGTVNYMSPEQVQGEEVDRRSDIFSFGAVLYEMITGRLPFRGDHAASVMYSIVSEDAQPLRRYNHEATDELERIVAKAMAKNRGERYQNMNDLLVDLRACRRDLETGTVSKKLAGKGSHRKRWVFVVGGLAVAVIALVVGRQYVTAPQGETINSIAVLPLENLSGDPAQDYFADGMTEALITDLAKIGALKVISRTSVMRFKGTNKSLPEIAKELGVQAVVEGSVLRVGERVRITAQLIEAQTDRHLWAESYDRDLRDVLTLQSELARTIANTIKVRLTPREKTSLARARTVDPEAYEAYLRGLYYWNKRTVADLTRSRDYFEQAIALDPGYADAYAGMGIAYVVTSTWGMIPPEEACQKAEYYAHKALAIDSTSVRAYTALGGAAVNQWKWAEAERLFKRALELNPNYATAHQWYGELLSVLGLHDEAVEEVKRARELDPLSLIINTAEALVYFHARRYDDAIARGERTLEIDPDFAPAHLILFGSFSGKKMYPQAIEHLMKMFEDEERREAAKNLPEIAARSGATGVLKWLLSRGYQLTNQPYNNAYYLAEAYAGLDMREEAFLKLDEAFRVHSGSMIHIKTDPALDNIRSDPRFAELLRKMGLEP